MLFVYYINMDTLVRDGYSMKIEKERCNKVKEYVIKLSKEQGIELSHS